MIQKRVTDLLLRAPFFLFISFLNLDHDWPKRLEIFVLINLLSRKKVHISINLMY